MRVEVSDNVVGAVIVICVVIALFNIGQCGLAERKLDVEENKLHIAAGQCRDGWGKWVKCP